MLLRTQYSLFTILEQYTDTQMTTFLRKVTIPTVSGALRHRIGKPTPARLSQHGSVYDYIYSSIMHMQCENAEFVAVISMRKSNVGSEMLQQKMCVAVPFVFCIADDELPFSASAHCESIEFPFLLHFYRHCRNHLCLPSPAQLKMNFCAFVDVMQFARHRTHSNANCTLYMCDEQSECNTQMARTMQIGCANNEVARKKTPTTTTAAAEICKCLPLGFPPDFPQMALRKRIGRRWRESFKVFGIAFEATVTEPRLNRVAL